MKSRKISSHHYRTQIDASSSYAADDTFIAVDGKITWNHGVILSVWQPFCQKVISDNKLVETFYQDLEMDPEEPISFSRIITGIYD